MPVERKRIEIRWRDLDGFGHVNNAVFLTYLEEVRDLWLQRHLADPPGQGEYLLARVAVDFRSQVVLDDVFVEAEADVLRVGRTSATLRERVLAGEERRVAIEAEVVVVRYDWASASPVPIDPALAASLAASTAAVPAQASSAAKSGESPSARPSA
jgi:acyl-CoA thioester hydrolase